MKTPVATALLVSLGIGLPGCVVQAPGVSLPFQLESQLDGMGTNTMMAIVTGRTTNGCATIPTIGTRTVNITTTTMTITNGSAIRHPSARRY